MRIIQTQLRFLGFLGADVGVMFVLGVVTIETLSLGMLLTTFLVLAGLTCVNYLYFDIQNRSFQIIYPDRIVITEASRYGEEDKTIKLSHLEEIEIDQAGLFRMALDYGTIKLKGGGRVHAQIDWVKHPHNVKGYLMQEMGK